MSVDTKGFIHSEKAREFKNYELIKFIEKEFGKVIDFSAGQCGHISIWFEDGTDNRSLNLFRNYTSYTHEGYPEFKNTTGNAIMNPYIVLFSIGAWGNAETIIGKILKRFGGQYILKNDCSGDWEQI